MTDRKVAVSLTAQVTGFLAGMDKAHKATLSVGTAAEKAARQIEAQKQAMESAGKGLMAVGLVAVAATALSVKAAIGWQSAWAGVTKTVNGTPAELAKVEEGLRSLAKTLPASHDEIAAVAEAAGQLGIQTASVTAFTRTMIDLGETTNLSADEAATSLARFMNVMGTSQDDVSRLGSTIVALGNNFATTEAEIVAMGMRLSGAGRQIGLSEGQVLGLSTALSSVGIEAEAGGSAISKVMIDIASEVANGGDKLELFAKTSGMSAADFSAQWKSDPGAALAGFVKGLSEAESQGGSTLGILEELGITEVRMRDALLRSASASDLFTKAMKDGDQAFEDNNALAEEAAKRYATVESQLQIMGNRVTDAAISFGEVFLPAVSAAAEGIGGFADVLGSMDPVLQGTVAAVGLVGGAVALAGGGFLLAIPKIAAYQVALVTLSTSSMPGVAKAAVGMMTATTKAGAAMAATAKFMTGPWGLAIAASVVGVGLLSTYLDSLKASSDEVANSMKTATSAADIFNKVGEGRQWSALADVKGQLNDLPSLLQEAADQSGNMWATIGGRESFGAIQALRDIGTELSNTASADLPEAQRQFRLLTAETDESAQSQWRLLASMPDYKDALTTQATALDINVTSSDEAANKTRLLELAFGDAAPVAITAADAYLAAADEADGLAGEIHTLMDAINEANGIGQDAVSSNASYQASLAGISDEVQRQKDEFIKLQEDGYLKTHDSLEGFKGSLKGFKLSLDESTAAGSANAASLSDVAGQAQDAAAAQYELDKKTMGTKDATDKYIETLGLSRDELAKTAEANGYNADQVQKLIDKVFALPSQAEIEILADTASAMNTLNNFISSSNGRRINLIVDGVAGRKVHTNGEEPIGRASGGILPGAPSRVDNMIIRAATGEFVTNATSTAIPDNRRALEFMNAGGTIRGYANGGQVGYASPVQYVPSGYGYGGGGGHSTTNSRGDTTWQITSTGVDPAELAAKIDGQVAWRERSGF